MAGKDGQDWIAREVQLSVMLRDELLFLLIEYEKD